jgi:hypothetical protein
MALAGAAFGHSTAGTQPVLEIGLTRRASPGGVESVLWINECRQMQNANALDRGGLPPSALPTGGFLATTVGDTALRA